MMALDHLVAIYQQGEDDQRARAEAAEGRVAQLEAAIGALFEVVTTTPFAEHHAFANERVQALHDAWKGENRESPD